MRKLLLAMYMSLDGYIEGPNREFTGPPFTPDLKRKWIDVNIDRAGIMLYGRTAYEGMAGYWTSPAADPDEAAILAKADKIVFSTKLSQTSTTRTRLERTFQPDRIRQLKATSDRDLTVGGPRLAAAMIAANLVDEFHAFVHPFIVGGGTPFLPQNVRVPLELVREQRLGRIVHLHYRRS